MTGNLTRLGELNLNISNLFISDFIFHSSDKLHIAGKKLPNEMPAMIIPKGHF